MKRLCGTSVKWTKLPCCTVCIKSCIVKRQQYPARQVRILCSWEYSSRLQQSQKAPRLRVWPSIPRREVTNPHASRSTLPIIIAAMCCHAVNDNSDWRFWYAEISTHTDGINIKRQFANCVVEHICPRVQGVRIPAPRWSKHTILCSWVHSALSP